MTETLKDHYITTGMVAHHWNEIGYHTIRNKKWNSDKVLKKFKVILKEIEDTIHAEGVLQNLYKSKNSKGYGHFIFMDTSHIMEQKQSLDRASFAQYIKILDNTPQYVSDFKTDTYESLQRIFILRDKVKSMECLRLDELEEIEIKLKNLLPELRKIEVLEIEDSSDGKLYNELMKQYENDKLTISNCISQFFSKTIKYPIYNDTYFVDEHYVKNGQIELLKEWTKKWRYIINNTALIYDNPYGATPSIKSIVEILQIWFEHEKYAKIVSLNKLQQDLNDSINNIIGKKEEQTKSKLFTAVDKIINEYKNDSNINYEKINTSICKDVKKTCMDWVLQTKKLAQEKLSNEIHHQFILQLALHELKEIYDIVKENVDYLNDAGQHAEDTIRTNQPIEDIFPYIQKCINIVSPFGEYCLINDENNLT